MQVDTPLDTEVQFVKGVGPDRAAKLERLGIATVGDLLWHLPREILDLTQVVPVSQLQADTDQTVRGTVADVDSMQLRNGRLMTAVLLDCGDEILRGVWFNSPWILNKFWLGQDVLFSAKPKRRSGRWEMTHPRVQVLEDEQSAESGGGVLPRYSLTEGLRMDELRRCVASAVRDFAEFVPDYLPASFRHKHQLVPAVEAIRSVHQPQTVAQYEAARHRLVFEDLLEFQLALAERRQAWRNEGAGVSVPYTAKIDARIRRLFPFRLTGGQDRAIEEITADMSSGRAMHRLLQADVGAGKTVVAMAAMLAVVAAGYQAVLMAPTELLAEQHWETLERALAHSRVRRRLLTGSLAAAVRKSALEEIANGNCDLVVGTQAVIQQAVRFHNLGLVVIDEQHKFGVEQRAHFSTPGSPPHVLVMTATPIPRSLCLTAFGDLDLTLIRELPPGRQPVVTSRVLGPAARTKAWKFIASQLKEGRQAYIVCPRIEAGEDLLDDVSAEATFERLSRNELRDFRLGLVHGRLSTPERAAVMESFREGTLQAIVSTTVVEVGVDIPNATLMAILQAERFGLSQLHQLRGRIGRGEFRGYCFLFSESTTAEAGERLTAMESLSDGFAIAEKDFEIRGPGDVLGTRQHGSLPLRIARLGSDIALLERTQKTARELVDTGAFDTPEFAPLKQQVTKRFSQLFGVGQTG